MEEKLFNAASKLPEASLDLHSIQQAPAPKPRRRLWNSVTVIAACAILMVALGFTAVGFTLYEAEEYNRALEFFTEHDLSTEGLSRYDIKAIYKDITTKSFSYSKTAQVITDSVHSDRVDGYEIQQDPATPDELEELWNNIHSPDNNDKGSEPGKGSEPTKQIIVNYKHRWEYKDYYSDGNMKYYKSIVERYEGEALVWSAEIYDFQVDGLCAVSDGVIAYGNNPWAANSRWPDTRNEHALMAKIDLNGSVLWVHELENGSQSESIAVIFENTDGSYDVMSRANLKYFCFSRISSGGEKISFNKTEIGVNSISAATRFGDGYAVSIGHSGLSRSRVIKVDREGNITDEFSYDEVVYQITDLIGYNEKLYLSAYTGVFGRSAVLLACDPDDGTPQEIYSVMNAVSGKLSLSESGSLIWDVKTIVSGKGAPPEISSYSYIATCLIYKYTFDSDGTLVSKEDTGERTTFIR